MSDEELQQGQAAELRRQAEASARERASQSLEHLESLSPAETRRRLHELRVHEIELELQNEELRRTQAELDAARARYFDLYDLAPVGYCTLSEQGLILETNLTAATLLGVARGLLVKQPMSRFVHEEDQDIYYLLRKRLWKTGAPQACEVRLANESDAPCWARFEATTGQHTDGELVCRLVISDITERRQREEELKLLESRLRQNQKLDAVGQLANGVAHDFNNLLMVIRGYVELAQDSIPADHPALVSLSTVLEATAQATGVTQALLTFSRGFEAIIEPVVPAVVVEEAARLLQRLLPRSIELTVDVPPEPRVWTLADRVQLKQVILNLATNARDAMPEGGRLRIACRPGPEDGLQGKNGETTAVRIEVADTGTGIPTAIAERIFDPFFTSKPRGRGTGLGLSLVHGIVKSLGGRIEVQSEVGQGSTFTILLPCHAGEPESGAVAPRRNAAHGHGETVLLADDNTQILELLTHALESYGYRIIPAGDGQEMLDLWELNRARIRLIVADNDMPKLSGLNSIHQIRKSGGLIPAVLITGAVEPDDADHLAANAIIMRKPFQMHELAERIRAVLDAARTPAS
jgi:two-component system, cell cycle sensor histidine kinase and response regulator CckA